MDKLRVSLIRAEKTREWGLQSKFVLVGVVLFAMPLVLHRVGYGKDLIAQIMMVYAVTTLLVTLTGAKPVDRLNSARLALFLGTLASGLGLALFGAATWAGGAAGGCGREWRYECCRHRADRTGMAAGEHQYRNRRSDRRYADPD